MPEPHPHFTLAGIPIRIEWSFWLIAVFLGVGARTGWLLLAWVAIVLVSVLVHELGHAVALRIFHQRPRVVLHAFGGLTYGSTGYRTRGESIIVSAAGPLTALVLLGLPAYLYFQSLDPLDEFTRPDFWVIVQDIAWVNIAWSVLNLLPILPLDGGNIAHAVLGRTPARVVSMVTAALAAVYLISIGVTFAGIFFLFFAVMNFNALQQERTGSSPPARTASLHVPRPRPSQERDLFAEGAQLLAEGRTNEGLTAIAAAYARRPNGPDSLAPAQLVARAGAATALASMLLAPNGAGAVAAASLQTHLHYAACYREAAAVGALVYYDGRAGRAQTAFDIACSLTRSGDNEHAMDWVRRAIADGLTSGDLLDGEPDLATLRVRADWPAVRALAD